MSKAAPRAAVVISPGDDGMQRSSFGALARSLLIGHIAFLTLVDLFATQAILPLLTRAYGVTPAAMGLAVNASTLGMAVASLAVAFFSQRIDRRRGIIISLALLAIPTFLLAFAPNLAVFASLRIAQGLCMASAFTLTLAYLGERCSAHDTAGAFAAYITGNVASNLFGRLMSAAAADHFGLASNFFVFAGLNVAGALLVYMTIDRVPAMEAEEPQKRPASHVLAMHLGNSGLRAAFLIGFCILFAFIGIFTYVNFVLVRPPIAIGMMTVGFVYFVFAPSFLTHSPGGKDGCPVWDKARSVDRPWICSYWLAAHAGAEARSCDRRDDPGRGWDFLCPSGYYGICRARGGHRSRRRKRHVFGLLFCRGTRRHRSAWLYL